MSSLLLAHPDREKPRTALAAARSQAGVTALFGAAAALAWWWTAERMAGMDAGPGTPLGTLGWFTGVWVVMMAAMMLPSLAPTAAARASSTRAAAVPSTSSGTARAAAGGLGHAVLFAVGYLLVWTAVGVTVYAVFAIASDLLAAQLAWNTAGRWVAGGVVALAAAYELTPLKAACLARCGSPRAFAPPAPREGSTGALLAGAHNGCWCLGCSGALMAALFALGAMSLIWMALLAGLIALEKLAPLPWQRAAVALTSVLLLALAIAMLAAPRDVPGLVVPGGPMHRMGAPAPTHTMHTMGSLTHMTAVPMHSH